MSGIGNPNPRIASAAATDDEIAPDLPSLMERMERARKHLLAEREYIKLIIIGGSFVVFGMLTSKTFPWPAYLTAALLLIPLLFGWYNLPRLRLANAFRNETLPFLLRDYGRWNYALEGAHFSREELAHSGLFGPNDGVGVNSIITGERFGVPLQMAVISVWPIARFGYFRGLRDIFTGWCANIRLPGLPQGKFQILPNGVQPLGTECKDWVARPFSASHQLWTARTAAVEIANSLQAKLLQIIIKAPGARFAIAGGMLWVLVPANLDRFHRAGSFNVMLNEPGPYHKTRAELAEMFELVDVVVWPEAG